MSAHQHQSKKEQDSMSTSSDALADALSSSLASIVASSSSGRRGGIEHRTSDATTMIAERRIRHGFAAPDDPKSGRRSDSNNDDEARSNHSSEDGGGGGGSSSGLSSSWSSSSHFTSAANAETGPGTLRTLHTASAVTDAALVSNTTGSSGGDDRDSSASGGRGGGGAGGGASSNKDSSSSDSGGDRNSSAGGDKGLPSAPSHDHGMGATRNHHHALHHAHHPPAQQNHHHHHHPPSMAQASSDGYGLPVPKDDRFSSSTGGQDRGQHASVVAHRLPPPQSSASSSDAAAAAAASNSSSGGDSDRGRESKMGGGGHGHHPVHRHVPLAFGGENRYEPGALVQPLREPGFHTIRRTFHRVSRRGGAEATASAAASRKDSAETDSSEEGAAPPHHHKHKSGAKRAATAASAAAAAASAKAFGSAPSDAHVADALVSKKESKKRKLPRPGRGSDNDESGGSGSSSDGGGTEGGYAGSASSNGNGSARGTGSCSSPSVSSSEDSVGQQRKRSKTGHALYSSTLNPSRPLLSRKRESSMSVSSEIADFSSGSEDGGEGARRGSFAAAFSQSSRSPSITSSDEQGDAAQAQSKERSVSRKVQASAAVAKKRHAPEWPALPVQVPRAQDSTLVVAASHVSKKNRRLSMVASRGTGNLKSDFPTLDGKPPILAVGCDVMAHVLTFLEPPDILDVLTMPLSKDWITGFTRQPELWRVLCLLDPFKAQLEYHEAGGSSSSSSASSSTNSSSDMSVDSLREETDLRRSVGAFRLLYTSFVRCLRYLSRIKDDAVNGRPPSVIDYGARPMAPNRSIRGNENLHQFLARARGVVLRDQVVDGSNVAASDAADSSDISDDDNPGGPQDGGEMAAVPAAADAAANAIGVSDDGSAASLPRGCSEGEPAAKDVPATACKQKKRVKYGHSMLTQRLLGPSADGTPGNSDLPWSCAIYSIVNWMVAFSDVEGIQTMCLKVLPFILEDEQQRMTAQRAGLTDIVLRGMVMFPDSTILHTAAFHTLVLLARPLGGREGMLFHSSMVNSSGIFSAENGSSDGRNGIAVMLDSMRRFQYNEVLQAMSCWSLVNIALAPSQKEMLVRLGGIEVTVNAMTIHPYSAEVNFRGLFALINFVIPSVSVSENPEGGPEADAGAIVPVEDTSEREMLDEMVDQLVNLVVTAMKNFCASEAILNRACLVLHNLSLTQDYHETLLLTPNCYQMLEWCLANYPTDQVLQQSAAGTLHRLQITLSSDSALRTRFTATLQQQQRDSLEQAHQEAILLSQQQEQQQQSAQPLDAAP